MRFMMRPDRMKRRLIKGKTIAATAMADRRKRRRKKGWKALEEREGYHDMNMTTLFYLRVLISRVLISRVLISYGTTTQQPCRTFGPCFQFKEVLFCGRKD